MTTGLFIKICGLHSQHDVEETVAMEPDALGFVFWPKSPRCVEPENVREWTKNLPANILKVGVFVSPSPKDLVTTSFTAALDVLQVYGMEVPKLIADLPFRMWKAVHPSHDVPPEPLAYDVDAIVLDSYTVESPGGTGLVGDWDYAQRFVAIQKKPVILAGGLTPNNVEDAVRHVKPWGVDVSSGVEASPGVKDIKKIRKFIQKCRSL